MEVGAVVAAVAGAEGVVVGEVAADDLGTAAEGGVGRVVWVVGNVGDHGGGGCKGGRRGAGCGSWGGGS